MQFTTLNNVRRQIAAMGCESYELGVYDAVSKRMRLRSWSPEAVLSTECLRYLAYENMQGHHIYIRPEGPHALTLLDDLTESAVCSLRTTGYQPALVVMTSPGNYQAWLKHSEVLASGHNDESTTAAKLLSATFGADPSSADWRHFGRLVGFTNRKPKYQSASSGFYPFVRLIADTGLVYDKASKFVATVRRQVADERQRRDAERLARQSTARAFPALAQGRAYTLADFQARYSEETHRADYAYALWALDHTINAQAIQQTLYDASTARSANGSSKRRSEYVERTVTNANRQLNGF